MKQTSGKAMTDTEKTIAKLRLYASCDGERYQIIDCRDIAVLCDEVEKRQWQPIETVPDEGEVLVYQPGGFMWIATDTKTELAGATHWMPLPSSPNAETK